MIGWPSCFGACGEEHVMVGVWFSQVLTSPKRKEEERDRASTSTKVMPLMPGGLFTRPVYLLRAPSWGVIL